MGALDGASYTYRVQWSPPGKPTRNTRYVSRYPVEQGQWISVEGVFLAVERVIPPKRGDGHDGLVLCKPAVG